MEATAQIAMQDLLNRARRSVLLGWLLDNPLLVREVRRRMRGRLFSWSLIAYIVALGGVSIVVVFASDPGDSAISLRDQIDRVGQVGIKLNGGMRVLELLVALVVAPLLTAGLASVEKERDTFDFLKVTTLDARTFVLGCLLTTACFLLLVFSCTLPVLALTFVYGGVSMAEIVSFKAIVFVSAMAICAFGVLISTNYRRSVSVLGSMVLLMFLFLFVGMSYLFNAIVRPMLGAPVTATGINWAATLGLAVPFFVAVVASVAAARRLYEPNNRFYNYTQFTILHFGLLAVGVAAAASNPPVARDVLALMLFGGWTMCVFGILTFSAGRVERGDEVWRIRMRFPALRRVPEDPLVHIAYASAWLGAMFAFAHLDAATTPARRMETVLPSVVAPTLASLVAAYCLARALSGYLELRGKTMLAATLVLFVAWAALPALGGLFLAIDGSGGPRTAFDAVGQFLIDVSPVAPVRRALDGDASGTLVAVAAQGVLAVAAILATLNPVWRERTSVSYRWIVRPTGEGADPAPSA